MMPRIDGVPAGAPDRCGRRGRHPSLNLNNPMAHRTTMKYLHRLLLIAGSTRAIFAHADDLLPKTLLTERGKLLVLRHRRLRQLPQAPHLGSAAEQGLVEA